MRKLILVLVVLVCAAGLPAQASSHLTLAETGDANTDGLRDLSGVVTFDLTDPVTGAYIEPREFQYTTPDNWATRGTGTVNLWFVFHGGGGHSDSMNRYFEEIPLTAPTVLVFPEATNGPNGTTRWRNVAFEADRTDPDAYLDVVFVEQLRAELLASNPQLSAVNVYASGFSSGGSMTWMLLCYRSSLFAGFGIYSKQLHVARRDGGCGDGHVPDATGAYTIDTGYEVLTGETPDLYGYNPALGASPTKTVLYQHGVADDNLDRSGTPGCSTAPTPCDPDKDPNLSMSGPATKLEDRDDISTVRWLLERHDRKKQDQSTVVPDEDPANGDDIVTTYAHRFTRPRNTGGVTSREQITWLEMVDQVHAISALDHHNDVCEDLVNGGHPPCNDSPNGSKDYDTSLANKMFFEHSAGMLI